MAATTDGMVTLRAPEAWRVRVDCAALLRGVSRSEFVRMATLERAELDLRAVARDRALRGVAVWPRWEDGER